VLGFDFAYRNIVRHKRHSIIAGNVARQKSQTIMTLVAIAGLLEKT
jgi:hypothetical protein